MVHFVSIGPIPCFAFEDLCDVLRSRFAARHKSTNGQIQIWTLAPDGKENPDLEFTVEAPFHVDSSGTPVYPLAAARFKVEWIARVFKSQIDQSLLDRLKPANHVGTLKRGKGN